MVKGFRVISLDWSLSDSVSLCLTLGFRIAVSSSRRTMIQRILSHVRFLSASGFFGTFFHSQVRPAVRGMTQLTISMDCWWFWKETKSCTNHLKPTVHIHHQSENIPKGTGADLKTNKRILLLQFFPKKMVSYVLSKAKRLFLQSILVRQCYTEEELLDIAQDCCRIYDGMV